MDGTLEWDKPRSDCIVTNVEKPPRYDGGVQRRGAENFLFLFWIEFK